VVGIWQATSRDLDPSSGRYRHRHSSRFVRAPCKNVAID
jgi:hypothetical protein